MEIMNLFDCLSEEHPASPSRSLDSEAEWMTTVVTCPSNFVSLLIDSGPNGLFGRTSLESCHRMEDGTLAPSSGRWRNSGMVAPTESWTLSTLEFRNGAVASSLSDILETGDHLRRYCLTATACRGIIRRAEKRGKALPTQLLQALHQVAGVPSEPDDSPT